MLNCIKVIFCSLLFALLIISTSSFAQYKLLKDINSVEGGAGSAEGYFSSTMFTMVQMGDFLYFDALDNKHGRELWKSDGSTEGTILVKDINPGLESSSPLHLTEFAGELYFMADDGIHGMEPWKSDGTEKGTVMLKDIYVGPEGDARRYKQVNGTLYFSADDGTHGVELWKTNGTSEGTVMVKDINSGADDSNARVLLFNDDNAGHVFYFTADDGIHGVELWISDGTEIGTRMIKEIRTGTEDPRISWEEGVGDEIYFRADDGIHGQELWKSNGTEEGTVLVKDIEEGAGRSAPVFFTEYLDLIYFRAIKNGNPNLWRTDGTEEGTYEVVNRELEFPLSPSRMTVISDVLYFSGRGGQNEYGLWKTDGTDDGTMLIDRINQTGSAFSSGVSSFSTYFVELGSATYFIADNGINGSELWKTDGTQEGTVLVKDIYPGKNQSAVYNLWKFKDKLYFGSNDGQHGKELWESDGTEEGTVLVKNINEGTGGGIT